MSNISALARSLASQLRRDEGQGTVEYALVLAAVAGIGAIIAAASIWPAMGDLFTTVGQKLNAAI
jgi:Flp pilus assembly pilin Flp